MKSGISYELLEKEDRVQVDFYEKGKKIEYFKIVYKKGIQSVKSPYLSWENFSYAYPVINEEEADDYLLNHALQENKKLCVCLWTQKPHELETHFVDYKTCVIASKTYEGYYHFFAVREGCLMDYYDFDEIEDKYDEYECHINSGTLWWLMQQELIELVKGTIEYNGVCYSPFMQIEAYGDNITQKLGPACAVVTGLLFGYPVESTVSLLDCNSLAFYGG